jgi:hypothetical protein
LWSVAHMRVRSGDLHSSCPATSFLPEACKQPPPKFPRQAEGSDHTAFRRGPQPPQPLAVAAELVTAATQETKVYTGFFNVEVLGSMNYTRMRLALTPPQRLLPHNKLHPCVRADLPNRGVCHLKTQSKLQHKINGAIRLYKGAHRRAVDA